MYDQMRTLRDHEGNLILNTFNYCVKIIGVEVCI